MVTYRFTLDDGRSFSFAVDRHRNDQALPGSGAHADWTRLGFRPCAHCPLDPRLHDWCPVAVDVENIAARFAPIVSCEKFRVEVETPERTYLKDCDAQTGLRSLLGLVMATSACPKLSPLKGLAMSHLPFATLTETIFRTVGAHLIKQYFVFKSGGTPDLNLRELDAFYHELQAVNRSFVDRLSAASQKDANLNAVVSLLYVSMGVAFSLEDNLQEMRDLF